MPDIIVSASDAKFFEFARDAIDSLFARGADKEFEVGFFDLGLEAEQRTYLESLGVLVADPTWTIDVPADQRFDRYLALVVRPFLRDFFPNRRVYFWFDADAWAQTEDFLAVYRDLAIEKGFSIAYENDPSYSRSMLELKWWHGNLLASFGPLQAVRLAVRTPINCGLFAIHHEAPHWGLWAETYQRAVTATGKPNMDQHALHAAIVLNNLPIGVAPCENNWIGTLAVPVWDEERGLLCKPYPPFAPISVMHLAGSSLKDDKLHELRTTDGKRIRKSLRYNGGSRRAQQSRG